MLDKDPSFKAPSRKHQPKGLTFLFEDRDIIVVDKSPGLLTMGTEREKENTAHFLLNDYIRKGNSRSRNRVYIVHRLDRETSGVLIFAKSEGAKEYLQDKWKNFSKKYFAVVHGKLAKPEGVFTSYLMENKAFRVYSTNDPNGKYAQTGYKVIRQSDLFSLVEVDLFTGRKHQIRVHFSEAGHPVAGDKIYGAADKSVKRLALHAASLTITHPFNGREMKFETDVPPYFKTLLKQRD